MSELPRVNKSLNSKYVGILNNSEQKVLETVEKSVVPIKPKEIASKTGINHNYVKVIVRKLCRLRFIHQPYYGHYESVKNLLTPNRLGREELFSVGSGRLRPCVHNLQFVVRGVGRVVEKSEFVFCFGRVLFHVKGNGTVVVYVSGEFDAVGFALLIEFIKGKLGVSEEQIVPKRIEFNNDIQGLQLNGAKCLTVKGVQGDLIRLYNKEKHIVRREIKPVRVPSTVAEIDALIQGGGLPSFYILQSVGRLVAEVKSTYEAIKFGNRTQAKFVSSLKTLLQKLLNDKKLGQ